MQHKLTIVEDGMDVFFSNYKLTFVRGIEHTPQTLNMPFGYDPICRRPPFLVLGYLGFLCRKKIRWDVRRWKVASYEKASAAMYSTVIKKSSPYVLSVVINQLKLIFLLLSVLISELSGISGTERILQINFQFRVDLFSENFRFIRFCRLSRIQWYIFCAIDVLNKTIFIAKT